MGDLSGDEYYETSKRSEDVTLIIEESNGSPWKCICRQLKEWYQQYQQSKCRQSKTRKRGSSEILTTHLWRWISKDIGGRLCVANVSLPWDVYRWLHKTPLWSVHVVWLFYHNQRKYPLWPPNLLINRNRVWKLLHTNIMYKFIVRYKNSSVYCRYFRLQMSCRRYTD